MAEHVPPPSGHGLVALAVLAEAEVSHVAHCTTCRAAWYRAGTWKAGCTAPTLGAQVSLALGDPGPVAPALRDHVAVCLACTIEQRSWAVFQTSRATPSLTLRRSLRRLANPAVRTRP